MALLKMLLKSESSTNSEESKSGGKGPPSRGAMRLGVRRPETVKVNPMGCEEVRAQLCCDEKDEAYQRGLKGKLILSVTFEARVSFDDGRGGSGKEFESLEVALNVLS